MGNNLAAVYGDDLLLRQAMMMDPMAQMMDDMLGGMDGNMEMMMSMFDMANETATSMIEQSPEYMAMMLALSNDIGATAESIMGMADGLSAVLTPLTEAAGKALDLVRDVSGIRICGDDLPGMDSAWYRLQPSLSTD